MNCERWSLGSIGAQAMRAAGSWRIIMIQVMSLLVSIQTYTPYIGFNKFFQINTIIPRSLNCRYKPKNNMSIEVHCGHMGWLYWTNASMNGSLSPEISFFFI
jgi:hypothetical protein